MTGEEILNHARTSILDDVYNEDFPEDNLWSNEELIVFLNEAEREACERAELIVDSSTANLAVFANFSAGVLALDPRVVYVKNAYWNGKQLTEVARDQIDCMYDWKNQTGQTPQWWFVDKSGLLTLFRKPSVAGTLVLEACRRPLRELTVDTFLDVCPEIAAHYHSHLCHWIAHKAYLKQDSETYDPNKAKRHSDLFEFKFGPPRSARDLVDRRTTGMKSVNFNRISVA